MGHPRKQRAKYSGPRHPWQRARLDEERIIRNSYGTKNKKEIWKMSAVLDKLADNAKKASGMKGSEADNAKRTVIEKAKKLGLLKEGQGIDEILSLKLKDIMERRLQTLVFKKGLALTIWQARQLITHEHIIVSGRKITSPSYVVPVHEEGAINFSHDSPFTRAEHPERVKYDELKKKTKPQEVAIEAEKKAKEIEKEKEKEVGIVTQEEIEVLEEIL